MKRTFRILTALVAALILSPAIQMVAQEMPQMPQLPVDPGVRIGKLDNGLTYYIRHNEKPKGQADFYIAQKVGSALEEDNQRGLAHFLEHMCFNGTTHFPGNSMIDWLETVGVKFGQNLNAYTSIDETVYHMSNVPVARTTVQDSCLLILHDWANDLLLEPAEIDKERGVIHEEWRSRNVGQQRIMERILPAIYPTTKYGHRLPIGTMEVVDNFPYQALRDYYETWYRPDLQGIVVVGDIDVDYIENKIKEIFNDIPAQPKGKKREYYPVPDHKGTIMAMGHDPEMAQNMVQISWLSDPMPLEMKNTQVYYVMQYIQSMVSMMLDNRFNEMSSKPDAPFAAAGSSFGGFLVSQRAKDAFDIYGVAKDNDIHEVLESIYRETLRAAQGGFTQSELDRAKSEYLSQIERAFNNRATRESAAYVNEYVRNFLDNDPIPGIETDYMIAQQVSAMIPLEAINQFMKEVVTKDNRVIICMQPEKEGTVYATEKSFDEVIKKVDAEKIEAFVDNVKTEPLIEKLPAPGKIVGEQKLAQWGAEEWVLSNGARVIVKPTKFKEDEILFTAFAKAGLADFGTKYKGHAAYIPSIIFGNASMGNYSLGTYTANDLTKYLSGKQVGLAPDFGDYTREWNGSSTPKDLQTLMELIYMGFTNLSYDKDEFASLQKQMAAVLRNQAENPEFVFSKVINKDLFKSPLRQQLSAELVEAATPEMTADIVKSLTSNAADWTFVFVGNVDVKKLRGLVEQYIATIPGNQMMSVKSVAEFDPDLFVTPGAATIIEKTKMETPQTYVAIVETGDLGEYTVKDRVAMMMLGQVMSKRLLKTVREDMGAVYSIGAQGALSRMGLRNAMIQTVFPMKPEMRDKVLDFIAGEFKAMESNIADDELAPIKEFMVKEAKEAKENNSGWNNAISGWLINGVDTFNPAIETISAMTVQDLMNVMKKLNNQNNYRVIVLEAEPK